MWCKMTSRFIMYTVHRFQLNCQARKYNVWSIMQLNCIHILVHMVSNTVTVLLGLLPKIKYWEYQRADSSHEFCKLNCIHILVHKAFSTVTELLGLCTT